MSTIGQALAVTAEVCGTEFSEPAALAIIGEIEKHPELEVLKALKRCMTELTGRLTLAAIIDRIDDSRPGVEEAWAMIPHGDESQTYVSTHEMAEAYGIVQHLDAIAARMAFREAYGKIIARNRSADVPVGWFPCLGTDKAGREIVLSEAVRIGRLSQTQVAGLLPPPEGEGTKAVLALISTNGILSDSNATEGEKITARERIDKIKAMLNGNQEAAK